MPLSHSSYMGNPDFESNLQYLMVGKTWERMNLTKDNFHLYNVPKYLNQTSATYELSVYHICMYTSETSQFKGTGFDSQSWVLVAQSFTHTTIQSSSVTTVSDMCEPKISSHVVGELFLWGKWGEDTHHAQDISDLTRATVDGRRYPRNSCRWYPSTHTKMYPHHDHDTVADTMSEM